MKVHVFESELSLLEVNYRQIDDSLLRVLSFLFGFFPSGGDSQKFFEFNGVASASFLSAITLTHFLCTASIPSNWELITILIIMTSKWIFRLPDNPLFRSKTRFVTCLSYAERRLKRWETFLLICSKAYSGKRRWEYWWVEKLAPEVLAASQLTLSQFACSQMVGLDAAGKTTILYKLKLGE